MFTRRETSLYLRRIVYCCGVCPCRPTRQWYAVNRVNRWGGQSVVSLSLCHSLTCSSFVVAIRLSDRLTHGRRPAPSSRPRRYHECGTPARKQGRSVSVWCMVWRGVMWSCRMTVLFVIAMIMLLALVSVIVVAHKHNNWATTDSDTACCVRTATQRQPHRVPQEQRQQ